MPELLSYLRSHRLAAACLVILTVAILGLRGAQLPLIEPTADQSQHLAYAYNMLKHGTFSINRGDRPRPDQVREPGYPLLLAAAMLLHPALDLDEVDAVCAVRGLGGCLETVTWLKLANLLTIGLSALAAFAAVLAVTARPVLAWAAFSWVMLSAGYAWFALRFFPETLAGLLVVLLSLSLWRLVALPPTRASAFGAGLLLGALVLTKATFYHLAPLVAVALAFHAARCRLLPVRQALAFGGLFLAGTLALTVPWHVRNLVSADTASLAGRGGIVLAVRANYNALPFPELMAAAAIFSPAGSILDAYLSSRWRTPELVEKLEGPDNPRERAFQRLGELRAQTGESTLGPEVDSLMRREAVARLIELWPQHLRATLLFGYRGLFAEPGFGFFPTRGEAETLGERRLVGDPGGWYVENTMSFSLLLFLPAFVAFAYCLATRRWALVMLMLPAAYLYGIQAFMTHYIPRYSSALIPMLVVIGMVSLSVLLDRLRVPRAGVPAGAGKSNA